MRNTFHVIKEQMYGWIIGVPIQFNQLCRYTTVIGYNNNNFTGSIEEIGNLESLESLYLDENQFSGEIPSEIGQLENLSLLKHYLKAILFLNL